MNMKTVGKIAMSALGVALTVGASIVNSKNQDARLEETITKKVAEALQDQVKES